MLDFVGTVLTAALMTFIINALVMYLDIGHGMKLAIAGIAGFWIGLAAAAGASGWLAISRPFPVIGIFVVTPLLAAAITATSPAARAALLRSADKAADRAEHRPCGRHAVSAASDGGPARGSVPILGRVGRYHHRRLCGGAPLRRGREECGSCRGVELLRHRRSRSRDLLRANLFRWRGAAALLLSTGLAGHAESALVVHSH